MNDTSASYGAISTAMNQLDTAVEDAIQQDQREADSFWRELWRRVTDLGSYNKNKQTFDESVEELKRRARTGVEKSREVMTRRFEPASGVPVGLEEDHGRWEESASDARQLIADLRAMAPVDGWTGPDADSYAAAVSVQVTAMSELRGVLNSAAEGAKEGATLHRALFAIAANACKNAKALGEEFGGPGGDGWYFKRTAAMGDYATQLPSILEQVADLTNLEQATTILNQQLGLCLSSGNLLTVGGWPTGNESAGVIPADTGTVLAGDAAGVTDFEIPRSTTPGVCTMGARR